MEAQADHESGSEDAEGQSVGPGRGPLTLCTNHRILSVPSLPCPVLIASDARNPCVSNFKQRRWRRSGSCS